MSNHVIVIIIIAIFAALSVSIVSGIILLTENYDDVKVVIPELVLDLNKSSNELVSEEKSDDKPNPLNKTVSSQHTSMDIQVEKFTTPEKRSIRISGDIQDLDPWKDVYIEIIDLEKGETIVTHSMSLKGDGHEFGQRYHHGFGYTINMEQFSPHVLYEVLVSHNEMKVSKTFSIDQLEEYAIIPKDDFSINKLGGVIWYGQSYRDGFDALSHLQKNHNVSFEKRTRPIENLEGAGLVWVGPPLKGIQFSDAEITELTRYVKNGGRLILTVDNDYAYCKPPASCALDMTRDNFGFGFTGSIQSGVVVHAQGKSDHPIWRSPNSVSSLSKWAEDGYVYQITDPKNVEVLARTTDTTKTPGKIHLAQDVAVIVINENPDFNGGRVLGAGHDMILDYGEFQMFDNVIAFMLEKKPLKEEKLANYSINNFTGP